MNDVDPSKLNLAAPWALGLGTAGAGFILFACAALLASAFLTFRNPDSRLSRLSFVLGCSSFFGAVTSLAVLFATNQFEFLYIYNHSALDHELRYRLAAVWSGQQGSFLLWATTSAIFGLLAVNKTGACRRWFTIIYSSFLAGLAGILTFESPFSLIPAFQGQTLVPLDGRGLPPSLLNYWVTIHPPTIFMGFGSLTVLFAWAVSSMLSGQTETWIKAVRPFAIWSLTLLGLGLGMGGFWAYETLGWGGFWMWDPVENTSFVPWCAAAALVHGIFIQVSRGKWNLVNPILGASPFLLFLYGTFLTRSGFLGDTSVHSFAQMDRSALWLLIGLSALSVALVVYASIVAKRAAPKKEQPAPESGILHKEAFYQGAVWLMFAFALVAAIGMSVPLIMSLGGRTPKVVDEHLYHQVLAWPFPPLVAMMAIAPFLGWSNTSPRVIATKLVNVLAITIGAVGLILLGLKQGQIGAVVDLNKTIHFFGNVTVLSMPWILILTGLCLFAIFANVLRLVQFWPRAKLGIGGVLTHIGVLIALVGLIFSRGFEQKAEVTVTSFKPAEAFGYQIGYQGSTKTLADRDNKIAFRVTKGSDTVVARPGLYFVDPKNGKEPSPMSWPDIKFHPFFDLYFVAYPPTFEASEPLPLKTGMVGVYNQNMAIKYNGLRTEGPLGQAGATFIADVTIDTPTGTQTLSPSLKMLGQGKFEYVDPVINSQYKIHLDRIDAKDRSATLSFMYVSPAYPVTIFYKPLAGFVWLGIGIMTLGGVLSAFSRRALGKRQQEPRGRAAESDAQGLDAPQPTSKI